MRRLRWLLCLTLALPAVLALGGCTSGDECDKCTDDADCKDGFFCTDFSDGSRRCGSGVGATSCRVK